MPKRSSPAREVQFDDLAIAALLADAAARPAAFAALRVVMTVKNPSLANFCAIAPPTPQRTPTGNSLSSTGLPCASNVLRPSACHFEVAPITTATGFPLVFLLPVSLISLRLLFFGRCFRDRPRAGHGCFSLTSSSGAAQGNGSIFISAGSSTRGPIPLGPEIIVDRREAHALVQDLLDFGQHRAALLGIGSVSCLRYSSSTSGQPP